MKNINSNSFEENVNSLLARLHELKRNSRNTLANPLSNLKNLYTEFESIIDKSESIDSNSLLLSIIGIKDWLEKVNTARNEYDTCAKKMEGLNNQFMHLDKSLSDTVHPDYNAILLKKADLDKKTLEYRTEFEDCENRNGKILLKYDHFKELISRLRDIYNVSSIGRNKLSRLRFKHNSISLIIKICKLLLALLAATIVDFLIKNLSAFELNKYSFLVTGILAYTLENISTKITINKIEEKTVWNSYDKLLDELIDSVNEIIQHYESLRSLINEND
jgi:hypothetical protein